MDNERLNNQKSEQEFMKSLSRLAEKNYQMPLGTVDYQFITDELYYLSGARAVILNTYEKDNEKSITRAASGSKEVLTKACEILNTKLIGQKWDVNFKRLENMQNGSQQAWQLEEYHSLQEIASGIISKEKSQLLEKELDLGTAYGIIIFYNNRVIGDILFAMPKDARIYNSEKIELYVKNVGITLMRTEAEKSLKENWDLLDGVFESIQDGISVLNNDLTIRYTNRIIAEWHYKNYPFNGKKCYHAYHDRDKPCDRCPSIRALETGEMEQEEITVTTDVGGKWLELYSYPLFENGSDHPTGVVEFVRDITDRKHSTEKLRKNKQYFEHILDSTYDPLCVLNRDLEIVSLNKHYRDILAEYTGKSLCQRDLVGKDLFSMQDFLPDFLKDECHQVFNNGTPLIKEEKFKINGEQYYVEVTKSPVFGDNGKVKFVIIVVRDITELKKKELQLKESERKFRQLAENIDHVFWMRSKDNQKVIYVNPAYETVWKRPRQELYQRADAFIKYVHPDDKYHVKQEYKEFLQTGIFNSEYRIVRPDGEVRWIWSRSNPVMDENGRVIRYAGLAVDITERKQAEEKIRYLSFYDRVTGLYNRAYLEEEIERLDVERQLPISIIIADVNGLKLINDTFGHDRGDDLLENAAGILKKVCRQEDIIGRWGGDEFVILLPQTSYTNAQQVLSRIHNECKRYELQTFALGVATKTSKEQSIKQVFKRAEERMYKNKLQESSKAKSDIITSLINTLLDKSDECSDHLKRVTELAQEMGRALKLSKQELERLADLAYVHDIGKVVIPEEIFNKSEKLTNEDWIKIKAHPEIGQRIARSTENLVHIAEEIGTHHERWDGQGYPSGLKGEEIPLLARIISIVDAYDVMTRGRIYQAAISSEKALKEIEQKAGTQFDPHLAEVFINEVNPNN
ncbi:HD domain-containing phosphohydrolase [Natranaerobius thermophilus]|uniref:Diguanylate cyclase and metal dependent phosphohydrolase n=1 Tax=Natranaerobius thermophilus (strain ATCC BAA-1301 / DSM 18059 / JW/NM-WN-LF) TaxID=457570 RepID=B2A167_NATTJ|nr:HD domain-containing phosphohydrolase [Natranaerobius thermophilus]ACB86008.1 diguanylate cyclase and metal dependent phosphohydrolase [Natranaerobius thermophilus JW/NM-WN-LF]